MSDAPAIVPRPHSQESPAPAPIGRPPAATPAAPRRGFMAALHRFTERFGHMLSRLLITALYMTLVLPGGVVISLFRDPLHVKRYRGTTWDDWQGSNETLARARRQD